MSKTCPDSQPEDGRRITLQELLQLKDECINRVRAGELYELRNDAKLQAVTTAKSYDEFKDIVDAAHLRPVTKRDKRDVRTRNRLWNSIAKEPPVP